MPSRGKRARRRPRVSARGSLYGQRTGLRVEEVITFSVALGSSTTVELRTLSSLPASTVFRPSRWIVESMQAFVPGTTTVPGYYCPAAIQCEIMEGRASSVTSPLMLCAAAVTRVVLVPRPDYPWMDPTIDNTTGLLRVTAVCIGPPASPGNAYLRGVIRVVVELQPETSASACPTFITSDAT